MAWLSGWSYRKEISVTGQSGAGTDFQVVFDIGDSAGGDFHLEGHCTNFPEDIEVTDNDGTTLLKFYIPDKTADPIEMWVKVADDLGSNQTIYVYYGKSGATTNSNGPDTFISHFDGDSTGWTEVDPNSHISFANNRLEWAGLHRGEDAYVYQSASVNDDVIIEFTFKQTAADAAAVAALGVASDMVDDWFHVDNGIQSFGNYYSTTYFNQAQKQVSDVRTEGTPNITYLLDTQYWIRSIVDRSGNLATSLYSNAARTSQVGSTSIISLSDLSATLQYSMLMSSFNTGGVYADRACSGWLDDFRVRKYLATEPAFSSAGSEETPAIDTSTDLLHGKIIIKDSSIILVDGLIQVKDSVTDLFDGEIKVIEKVTSLADGKLQVKDVATSLADGKLQVKDIVTGVADGKVQIQDTDTDLADGKLQVQDVDTDLADGIIQVKDSITSLADGKVQIQDTDIDLADGKVKVQDSATDIADGKVQVLDVATGLTDGLLRVKDKATGLADGKVQIQDTTTSLADGKVQVKDSVTNLIDGKVIVSTVSTATGLADGKIQIKDVATGIVDGLLKIVVAIRRISIGNLKPSFRLITKNQKPSYRLVAEQPKPTYRLKTENK